MQWTTGNWQKANSSAIGKEPNTNEMGKYQIPVQLARNRPSWPQGQHRPEFSIAFLPVVMFVIFVIFCDICDFLVIFVFFVMLL